MVQAQNSFKHYINSLKTVDNERLTKTRRRMNKRSWRGRWYGIGTGLTTFTGVGGAADGANGSSGMMGEGIHAWREIEPPYEEEQEDKPEDLDAAPQDDSISSNDTTELQGDEDFDFDDEVQQEEPEDPDRQGIIRTVQDAHLVYKRQQEDGTFEELWIYNIGDRLQNEVNIRRDILAGTDIPVKKTRTSDGQQNYEMWTAGNAQLIHISGLPN